MNSRLLVLALLTFSQLSYANEFSSCTYLFLAKNCAFATDNLAPADMIKEGAAACYVAKEITPKKEKKILSYVSNIINEKKLNKNDFSYEIEETQSCIRDANSFAECQLITFSYQNKKAGGSVCK